MLIELELTLDKGDLSTARDRSAGQQECRGRGMPETRQAADRGGVLPLKP